MQDGRTGILSIESAVSHEEGERMIWRKPAFMVEGASGVTLNGYLSDSEGEYVGS